MNEIKEMSIEEVETRSLEIKAEAESADESRMNELKAELDSLEERKAELKTTFNSAFLISRFLPEQDNDPKNTRRFPHLSGTSPPSRPGGHL